MNNQNNNVIGGTSFASESVMLRNRTQLSQQAVAHFLGVPRATLQNWESGRKIPSPAQVQKLIEEYTYLSAFTKAHELEEAKNLWMLANLRPAFDEVWFQGILLHTQQHNAVQTGNAYSVFTHVIWTVIGLVIIAGLIIAGVTGLFSNEISIILTGIGAACTLLSWALALPSPFVARANNKGNRLPRLSLSYFIQAFKHSSTAKISISILAILIIASPIVLVLQPFPHYLAIPNTKFKGILKYDNLLTKNYFLSTNLQDGAGCAFQNSEYTITAVKQGVIMSCLSPTIDVDNFALQVRMTFGEDGDAGGILFRSTDSGESGYRFTLNNLGVCGFDILSQNTIVTSMDCGAITIEASRQKSHFITLVAYGELIQIYIDNFQMEPVRDLRYDQGRIGFFAAQYKTADQPTRVTFSSAQLWTSLTS